MAIAPIITALYAAIMAAMLLALSANVIMGRFKYKIVIGDNANNDMNQRIRMQGNFIEYVPMLLMIMLILELNNMHEWMLHSFGITLIVARALHAYGLSTTSGLSIFRFSGTVLTFSLFIYGIITCLILNFL